MIFSKLCPRGSKIRKHLVASVTKKNTHRTVSGIDISHATGLQEPTWHHLKIRSLQIHIFTCISKVNSFFSAPEPLASCRKWEFRASHCCVPQGMHGKFEENTIKSKHPPENKWIGLAWKTITDCVATMPLQNKRSKSTINLVMAHFEGNLSRASFKFYFIYQNVFPFQSHVPGLMVFHHTASPPTFWGDITSQFFYQNIFLRIRIVGTWTEMKKFMEYQHILGGADHLGQSSILATTK